MNVPPTSTTENAIHQGMVRQGQARTAALASGARHVGWKVALTTPGARAAARVDRSLVGYLTDRTGLRSGDRIDVGKWTRPTIEAELALFIGAEVPADAGRDAAAGAIAAVGAAIEVVDVAFGLDEVEELLAGDIFHRHYVLGQPDGTRAGGLISDIRIEAWLDDELVAAEDAPVTVIGEPVDVALAVAAELAGADLTLGAGDIILAGSAIPLTPVRAGQRLSVRAAGLGELALSFIG